MTETTGNPRRARAPLSSEHRSALIRRVGVFAFLVAAACACGPARAEDAPPVTFLRDDGTTIIATWLADAATNLDRGDESVVAERPLTVAALGEIPPNELAAWPVPDGRVGKAIERLPSIVTEMMSATGVPGLAVAVVHGDEIAYAEGFGERRMGSRELVDADTVFQIASISKSVGATVVAGVVGDGTVAWDDPVVDHLPSFTLSDPWVTGQVTIADLYSHRSGLPDHAGDPLEDLGFGRDEILERLRFLPLAPFRAEYAYTNFGLTAAAEAVAAAAGATWEELSRRRLYEPIGMTRTSSTYADFVARSNQALGHQRVGDEWSFVEQREPDAQSPAGGVSSSARDMARWMRLLLAEGTFDSHRVIDREALLAVQTPHMRASPKASAIARPSFYGLGMGVSTDATARVQLSHSGAFLLGAATSFAAVPAVDVGIVVLTNAQPIGLPEAIISAFLDVVALGEVTRVWLSAYQAMFAPLLAGPPSRLDSAAEPTKPRPPAAPSVYVGTYANDFYGPVRIDTAEEGLVLTAGPRGMTFGLEHWDGHTLSFETGGENRSSISALDFTVAPDGTATGLRIEKWDEPTGVGQFIRSDVPGLEEEQEMSASDTPGRPPLRLESLPANRLLVLRSPP